MIWFACSTLVAGEVGLVGGSLGGGVGRLAALYLALCVCVTFVAVFVAVVCKGSGDKTPAVIACVYICTLRCIKM